MDDFTGYFLEKTKNQEESKNAVLHYILLLFSLFFFCQFLTTVKNPVVFPKGPFEAAKEPLWACQRDPLTSSLGPFHFVTWPFWENGSRCTSGTKFANYKKYHCAWPIKAHPVVKPDALDALKSK